MDLFDDDLSVDMGGGKKPSPRTQAIARVVFGLLGTALGMVGAFQIAWKDAGWHLRLPGTLLFAGLALACFWNIALHRPGKAPAFMMIFGFAGLFFARIVFGT